MPRLLRVSRGAASRHPNQGIFNRLSIYRRRTFNGRLRHTNRALCNEFCNVGNTASIAPIAGQVVARISRPADYFADSCAYAIGSAIPRRNSRRLGLVRVLSGWRKARNSGDVRIILPRLIVVSNQVSMPCSGEPLRAGGLEVALAPVLKDIQSIWFGWSGNVVDADKVSTRRMEHGRRAYVVTDLSHEDHEEYYNGFANRVLWPILHYRIDLTEFTRRDLTGYFRVNRHFARELANVVRPDDVIWVHDYHLIPIATELRQKGHMKSHRLFSSRSISSARDYDGAAQPRSIASPIAAI